jgi:glutaredoxin
VEIVRVFRLVLLAVVVLVAGCKGKAPPASASVPLPLVTDTSADLLLTWIDEKGEFHVEQKVADVPPGSREVVRVADPVKDPPKLDDVFVVDLRTAGADGAYPVRTMSRPEFEKIAVERRQQHGKVLTPQPAASAPPSGDPHEIGSPTVIIYGASWCGACHQAAAYLKRRGVPFIEKDIEQDGGAAREMQAKLASAGMRGGSIPVIDVRGKVMIGFDERAVDRALSRAL